MKKTESQAEQFTCTITKCCSNQLENNVQLERLRFGTYCQVLTSLAQSQQTRTMRSNSSHYGVHGAAEETALKAERASHSLLARNPEKHRAGGEKHDASASGIVAVSQVGTAAVAS